jgi:protease IV
MRRLLTIFLVLVALGAALAAVGVALARRSGAVPRLLAADRVLSLDLGGELPDYRPPSPLPWLERRAGSDLAGLWWALAAARRDPAVRAVAVRIDDLGAGLAKAQELRRQLAATAAAGKRVDCYLDTAGEGSNGTLEYYVASGCSSISLAPVGEINLLGLYADPLFLRGTLDKLKLEAEFIAAGRYKSLGETYTETAHSPAAREAIDAVLDGYWRQLVGDLAAARSLTPERIRALVDEAPLSASGALRAKLVDHVEYADELRERLDAALGGTPEWVELDDYLRGVKNPVAGRNAVAVVFAQGTIVRGKGGVAPWTSEMLIGSDGLGDLLDELAEDDGVSAVVVRVDSGGGSAVASDLLHRRVTRLARAKPVVVSMSDLAASGGYYLAMGAQRIVAEPATLTGSIGVVSGKLATGRFESELLGATRDPLARGARAGIYATSQPFDADERGALEARIGEIYDRFLGVVAAGRDLPRPAVERVAQGRVWVGEDAFETFVVGKSNEFAHAAARSVGDRPL